MALEDQDDDDDETKMKKLLKENKTLKEQLEGKEHSFVLVLHVKIVIPIRLSIQHLVFTSEMFVSPSVSNEQSQQTGHQVPRPCKSSLDQRKSQVPARKPR